MIDYRNKSIELQGSSYSTDFTLQLEQALKAAHAAGLEEAAKIASEHVDIMVNDEAKWIYRDILARAKEVCE